MTAFSRDGTLAAVAYRKTNHIRVFSMATQELLCTLQGHSQTIHGLAFHPDGKQLLSASLDDFTPHTWDVTTGQQSTVVGTRVEGNSGVGCVAWAPDGSVWAGNMPWGLAGLEKFLAYGEMACPYNPIAWLPDGKNLIANGMLFDRASGEMARLSSPFGMTGGQSPCLASGSPDSRFVALPESRNYSVIWDVNNVQVHSALITLKRGDHYDCLAANPAGHYVWLSPAGPPRVRHTDRRRPGSAHAC